MMESKHAALSSDQQRAQKIPGLTLLEVAQPITNMQSTSKASIPALAGNGAASGQLMGIEEFLASNTEPNSPPSQAKKSKPKSVSPSIPPIPVDINDKTNWVGKLHEYWALLPEKGTIVEEVLDTPPPHLFTCTITTGVSPEPFGGSLFPCLSKKQAKHNAAKLAVQFLMRTGHIDSDTDESKKPASPAGPSAPTIPLEDQSVPAQVNILSHKLGFKSPTYTIELLPGSTAIYKGYAKFVGEPLIEGKVGEFHNIWAKKAAKEHCAKEVLKFLKDIDKLREEMSKEDASGEKRKLEVLESPEKKDGAKISRYDGCDDEDESSVYGTPEPFP